MHNPEDRSFIGHPRGLGYISFAEAWERFSYYGMQSLLVLYMVNRLLHPGHVEHDRRVRAIPPSVEYFRGSLSVQALASTIFGLYTGFVYLTPIAGGLIADRFLGRTTTITIGALLMSAGHFLMAFDLTFLVALLCLLLGVGCFKGNLASQVGALYATGDNRRADAFQIYYLFINGGRHHLATRHRHTRRESWLALGIRRRRRGHVDWPDDLSVPAGNIFHPIHPLSKSTIRRRENTTHPSRERWQSSRCSRSCRCSRISFIGNQQIFNAYLVWAEKTANFPSSSERQMPTTWLITLDSSSVGQLSRGRGGVLATLVEEISGAGGDHQAWHRQPLRGDWIPFSRQPARRSLPALAGKVSIGWLITFHLLNSIGFANVFPVSIALYARVAPAALSATIIGIYYLAFFAANNLVGWIGGFLEKMPATSFLAYARRFLP